MTSFIGFRPRARPHFFLIPLEIISRPLGPVSTALVRYHELVHVAETGTVWLKDRSTTSEEDQTQFLSVVKANSESNKFQNQVHTYVLRYLELAHRLLSEQRKLREWVLITAEDALQSQPLGFSDSEEQLPDIAIQARNYTDTPRSPSFQGFVSSPSSDGYVADSIESDFKTTQEEAKQGIVSSTRVSSFNSTSDVSTRGSSIWDDVEDAHDVYENGTDTSGFIDSSLELEKATLDEDKESWDDDLDSLFDESVASFDEDLPEHDPHDTTVSSPESEQERTITLTPGLTVHFNSTQPLSPIQSCVTAEGTTTPPRTPPTYSILRSPQGVSRMMLTTTPPTPPIFNPAVAAPRSTFTFTPPSMNLPTIFTPCSPARAGPGPLPNTRLRRVQLASTPRSTTKPTSTATSPPSLPTSDADFDSDSEIDSPPALLRHTVLTTRAHSTPHAIHRRRPSHPSLLTLEAENTYLKAKLQQSESVDLYLRKILVHTFSEREIHKDKSTRLTRQTGKLKDVMLWLIRKKGKLSAELGMAREDVQKKQREIEALEVQVEGVRESLAGMTEERDELWEELGEMGLEMRLMSEELEGEREKVARQEEEFASQKEKMKRTRREPLNQKEQLASTRDEFAKERGETHTLRKRVSWLEDWVDGLHEERTWLREERQGLLREKEGRQKEIQMLVEGYERLQGVVEGVVGKDSWREETDMEDEEGLDVIEEEGEDDNVEDGEEVQSYSARVGDGELIVKVGNVRDSLEGLKLEA